MSFFKRLDKKAMLARTIPSIFLFIAAFIILTIYTENNILNNLGFSWIIGGFIWGWTLTNKWFSRFSFREFFSDLLSRSFAVNTFAFIGLLFKMLLSMIVGLVMLPIGIIITILSIFGVGKDAYDQALAAAINQQNLQSNANNIQGNQNSSNFKINNP